MHGGYEHNYVVAKWRQSFGNYLIMQSCEHDLAQILWRVIWMAVEKWPQ